MNKVKYNAQNQIIVNLLLITLGILFIFRTERVWNLFTLFTGLILLYQAFSTLAGFLISKKKNIYNLGSFLTNFILAMIILFRSQFYAYFIYQIFGFYALIHALIGYITFYVLRRDNLSGSFSTFVGSTITLLFGLSLLGTIKNPWILAGLLGSYLIYYGFVKLVIAINELLTPATAKKISRSFSVAMPVFLSALIPQQTFISIDKMLKKEQEHPQEYHSYPLEVLIYLKKSGPESLGHVDICFNGTIYSYGCHDPEARGLMGTLGDGVMIEANRDQFIHQATHTDHKTVLCFGIEASPRQMELIQKRLDQLKNRSVPWLCEAAKQEADGKEMAAKDYASRVYRETKAKMMKFKEGKFKTYFVFSTNCVLLADYLIRSREMDLVHMSGIVTPGSYINFLYDQYARKNSEVRSFTVYAPPQSSQSIASSSPIEPIKSN